MPMTRGRKPDGPALQAMKGSPGKRARTRNMDSRTVRLAANDPLTPPDFLKVKRGETGQDLGLKIWRELAPHLQRRNLLDRMDRYAFARWCVYQAEWIEATQAIRAEGISKMVKTVSGDEMLRRNPSALHRDKVELAMVKLEAAYGLTPADRYRVMRDQAAAPLGGLFGNGDESGERPTTPSAPAAADPVGFLSARATPTPGTRPN